MSRAGEATAPLPSRGAMCHMAGNAMHTNVIGIVLLYCATQIAIDPYAVQLACRRAIVVFDPRRIAHRKPDKALL